MMIDSVCAGRANLLMTPMYHGFNPDGKRIVTAQSTNPLRCWTLLRTETRTHNRTMRQLRGDGYRVKRTGWIAL
jgi:hypothetical protein